MNKFRLKRIQDTIIELRSAECIINACDDELNDIYEEEYEVLENTPENLKEGENFKEKSDKCDDLEDIKNEITEVSTTLSELIEKLEVLY